MNSGDIMTNDAFDEGIALGGLRSKREIKVLICYLFASVNDSLSESLVTEAIIEYELANFFEVKAAFDELLRGENLRKAGIVDNEQTYLLTEQGKMIASQLESTLAYSVKEKALKCAVELLAERKTARENTVEITKDENGYRVNCHVSGGDVDLLQFSLYAPDIEQAELMKQSFLSYPAVVFKTMLALMTKNKESVGEALEELFLR